MNVERHSQVKALFLEVSQLPEPQRLDVLRERCGDDHELLFEVESLLRHHRSETLLTRSTVTVPASLGDTQQLTEIMNTLPSRPQPVLKRIQRAISSRSPAARNPIVGGGIVAGLILAVIGWWSHSAIESSLRSMRTSELDILLQSNVSALEYWMNHERGQVTSWARDPGLRRSVEQLAATPRASESDSSKVTEYHAGIGERLAAVGGERTDYLIWDRNYRILSRSSDGESPTLTEAGAAVLTRAFKGETLLRMPHHGFLTRLSPVPGRDETGDPTAKNAEHARMSVVAPIRSLDGDQVIAAIMLRGTGGEEEFHRILTRVRAEESGETYAFDANGVMISESRFEDQLKRIGLIPNDPDAKSSMVVQIRDPGGDLTRGYQPGRPLAARPLTQMAAFATSGESGLDLDGYRDYRGIRVIGAWTWLPEYEFGVTTEIDYDEAYAPLQYLNIAFGVVFGLLTTAVGVILFSSVSIVRLKHEVSESQKLGQYTLERRIGEGGMGDVYLARHVFLKRPTAVKLLKPGVVNRRTRVWFEREVQLVSQLSHPNTIQIYDYGRTPEGLYFYAMEYLDGLNLAQLVSKEGAVPPARVIHILHQTCQSLREAHAMGLVHRDIKPHNIMICRRAGEADFVKVLDFGLVKELDDEKTRQVTVTSALAGTPLYMSPERLRNPLDVDVRADVYALGAVAFKLLTGRDVFVARSEADVLDQVLHGTPTRPSEISAFNIPEDLELLVLQCLARAPDERPQSVAEMLVVLDSVHCEHRWGQTDAQRWWDRESSEISMYRHVPESSP